MSLSSLIALRYLLSLRKLSFISIITSLSFIGLVIGVAALICVTSIFNGFRFLVKDILLTVDPHIRIHSYHGKTLDNYQSLHATLSSISNIQDIHKVHNSRIVISCNSIIQAGVLKSQEHYIKKNVLLKNNYNTVRIGIGLANKLQAKIGDTISLYTPTMLDASSSGLFQPTGLPVIIEDIFQISSGVDYDNSFVIAPLTISQELYGNSITDVDIFLYDLNSLQSTVDSINNKLSKEYQIDTWESLHTELYATMEFERNASFIVISLVACVSAFNILISLWMTVRKKRVDIAILQSMGMKSRHIQTIFLFEGLIIGVLGTISGLIIGIGLCLGQQHYGWISLPNSIVSSMPVYIDYIDVSYSCLLALIFSLLSTLYPSFHSITLSISSSLRSE